MLPAVRFPIVLVLVSLFSSVTGAPGFVRAAKPPQPQVVEQVERLLASGTPRDRAWAAHLCMKHDERSLLPKLAERLAPEPGNTANLVANQTILDALIRLDGTAPAERLIPLLFLHSDEVVILMAREPAKNQAALLSFIKDGRLRTVSQRIFVYGVLLHQRSPGFAAHLLDRQLKIAIPVYDDPADLPRGVPQGHIGVDILRPSFSVPKTFPPVTIHSLTGSNPPEKDPLTFIGDFPVQVYLYTNTIEPGEIASPATPDTWDSHHEGTFLAQLLKREPPEQAWLFPWFYLPVVCADPADLPLLVEEQRKVVTDTFNELKQSLLAEGLLTRQEFDALAPRIETVWLYDHRKNRTTPLPAVPQTESR